MPDFKSAGLPQLVAKVALASVLALSVGLFARGGWAVVGEEVDTEGEIPVDLNGVWLMVTTLEFANGQYVTLPHLYRITHIPLKIAEKLRAKPKPTPTPSEDEGKILIPRVVKRTKIVGDDIEIMFFDVEMPDAIKSELEKLGLEKKPWVPGEDDLKLVAEKWESLKPRDPSEYAEIKYRIVPAENFDDSLKTDEATRGAKLAIIATQTLIAGPKSTGGTVIFVWGVREVKADRLEGSVVRSHLAGAPFPVAITAPGKFVMYKLADVAREWEKEVETVSSPSASQTPPSPAPTPASAPESK